MRTAPCILLLLLHASCERAEAPRVDRSSPVCTSDCTSSLPGVSIVVQGPCVFTLAQAAAGITVPYKVVVAADVKGVQPSPQDAGGCGRPGESGLILFESLSGQRQRYSLSDTGLCAESVEVTTVPAGTWLANFRWTGRNWGGPSDTSRPMGAPFPAGTYTFRVSAVGQWNGSAFAVNATYPITLVP
jgi:hypothetical protein